MKYLIVSDSHRNDEILSSLYKEYPDCDVYIHAGDSCSDMYSIYPFDSVLGNCDFYSFPERKHLTSEVGNILIKHHPGLSSKEKENTRIFIHGHTHCYKVKEEDGILIINPGSVTHPRDGSNGSFAILRIENGCIYVDVIDVFSKNILIHYQIM